MSLASLPALNAALNATCAAMLLVGYVFIRQGKIKAHRAAMALAFMVSALFLASYLYYHAQMGSKPYTGQGWLRPLYFSILISHSILAALIVPMALTTLAYAWRGLYDRHRRIARWTWPLWMYVSVTGVVIYAMLYR